MFYKFQINSQKNYKVKKKNIPSTATHDKNFQGSNKGTYLENYTVFRVKWCTYLPGSPKLNKQANPKDAVFRITGGKILAGSQACQMENLFWMAKCYEIVKFLDLTHRLTQCYNFQFILRKFNRRSWFTSSNELPPTRPTDGSKKFL